ncbi:MAG TPA: hypothetical protein ENI15_19415 [Spirochaetes bacterium]|nr:hypothetical protein [Spirochaetota bacterium]
MKKSYLIGIDAGVSFVKAGVYDLKGNCEGAVNKSSQGDYPSPGVFIQKNEDYLSKVLNALKEAVEKSGIDRSAFELLDEKAGKLSPGSDGLLSVSLLGGRGYPSDPDIKGMWIGHTWSHKKAHFYRSMLESFAYEYGFVLNVMKKNYPEINFSEVRVIGGGARSGLWNQIKCDVTGLKYTKLTRDDFTLLGDVLIAGHAVGIYKDLKEVSQKYATKDKNYVPDRDNQKSL